MFLIFLPNFSIVSYRAVSYKMKLRVHYLFSTIKNVWNSLCRKTNDRMKVFAVKVLSKKRTVWVQI